MPLGSVGRRTGGRPPSVVADVPHPAPLGTAAQDCPMVGRSFVVRATLHPHQEDQMKYAMLIYEKPGYIEELS